MQRVDSKHSVNLCEFSVVLRVIFNACYTELHRVSTEDHRGIFDHFKCF